MIQFAFKCQNKLSNVFNRIFVLHEYFRLKTDIWTFLELSHKQKLNQMDDFNIRSLMLLNHKKTESIVILMIKNQMFLSQCFSMIIHKKLLTSIAGLL